MIRFDVERDDPLTELEREERNVRAAFMWIFALVGLLLFLVYVAAQN